MKLLFSPSFAPLLCIHYCSLPTATIKREKHGQKIPLSLMTHWPTSFCSQWHTRESYHKHHTQKMPLTPRCPFIASSSDLLAWIQNRASTRAVARHFNPNVTTPTKQTRTEKKKAKRETNPRTYLFPNFKPNYISLYLVQLKISQKCPAMIYSKLNELPVVSSLASVTKIWECRCKPKWLQTRHFLMFCWFE